MTNEISKVELLVCKCRSCTHWEIGRDFIHCKTCGDTIKAAISVDMHDGVHWELHERDV